MPDFRRSVRVKTAAELIDCHVSMIYRAIENREPEIHGVGKRGIRIYLDSLETYQLRQRHDRGPANDDSAGTPKAQPKRRIKSPGYRAAIDELRSAGILP